MESQEQNKLKKLFLKIALISTGALCLLFILSEIDRVHVHNLATYFSFGVSFSMWFIHPVIVMIYLIVKTKNDKKTVSGSFKFIFYLTKMAVLLSVGACLVIWFGPNFSSKEHPFLGSGNFGFLIMPLFSIISILGTFLIGSLISIVGAMNKKST